MQELITAHDDGKQDGVITLEEFQQLSKDPRFRYVLDSIPSVTTAADCSACSAAPIGQTLQGSFSAASKPNFASKYAFESSRRDLHNALLCTALK